WVCASLCVSDFDGERRSLEVLPAASLADLAIVPTVLPCTTSLAVVVTRHADAQPIVTATAEPEAMTFGAGAAGGRRGGAGGGGAVAVMWNGAETCGASGLPAASTA